MYTKPDTPAYLELSAEIQNFIKVHQLVHHLRFLGREWPFSALVPPTWSSRAHRLALVRRQRQALPICLFLPPAVPLPLFCVQPLAWNAILVAGLTPSPSPDALQLKRADPESKPWRAAAQLIETAITSRRPCPWQPSSAPARRSTPS